MMIVIQMMGMVVLLLVQLRLDILARKVQNMRLVSGPPMEGTSAMRLVVMVTI